MSKILIILTSFIAISCGYVNSGTWVDDPDNWERAYNEPKPDNIEIIKSEFTRYPHFTYEFDFYVQIKPNVEVIRGFLGTRNLKQIEYSDIVTAGQTPNWFVPGEQSDYEIYRSQNNFDNLELFINHQTGEIFWIESQY